MTAAEMYSVTHPRLLPIHQKKLYLCASFHKICAWTTQSHAPYFLAPRWYNYEEVQGNPTQGRARVILYTVEVKKTVPKTFCFDGQNGASVSISVYRFQFSVFRSVPFLRLVVWLFSIFQHRVPRYIHALVATKLSKCGDSGDGRKIKNGEWQMSDRGHA